jgi:poly(A) polymerase
MIRKFDEKIQHLLAHVLSCVPDETQVFLVGGAIRDVLLQRTVKDIDIVIEGEIKPIFSRLKRSLNAQAFMLDDERQTGRILNHISGDTTITIDLVKMNKGGLNTDLLERDFTVNAIALDLHHPEHWIDPLNGVNDLEQKTLRCCSDRSMILDPLRILRGIRFSLGYQMKIEDSTSVLMKAEAGNLSNVSNERVRDEFFKILQSGHPLKGMQLMDAVDCIRPILPELLALKNVPAVKPHALALWDHSLKVMEYLNLIILAINDIQLEPLNSNLFLEKCIHALRLYSEQYKALFAREYPENRTRQGLLLFAALFHDTGKPTKMIIGADQRLHFYGHENESSLLVSDRAKALCLSRQEVDYQVRVVKNHMRVHFLVMSKDPFTDRAIHRFFRDTGELGLDICLLTMADLLATYEETLTETQFEKELNVVLRLLEGWFTKKDTVVSPPRVLDGNDIQAIFGLPPGPLLKEILTSLHEAQAIKQVRTREEAIGFVKQFLNKNRKR